MTVGHVRASSCPGCPPEQRGLVANGLFFSLLAIDLLPALIYVFGVRSWKRVRFWGVALILLSGLPWLLDLVNEQFVAIAFVGYPVLFIGCSVAALKDIKASIAHRGVLDLTES
jgi:hypothetical protein